MGKLDHLTTPIDLIIMPEETVTITDPCHPLFGRTLPLIGIMNSSSRGRCCVVWIRPTVERHVPVAATNLEYIPEHHMYPLPITVQSLQQLLHEFTLVSHDSKGVSHHGDSPPSSPACFAEGSEATSSVGDIDGPAANTDRSGPGSHVPGMLDHARGEPS